MNRKLSIDFKRIREHNIKAKIKELAYEDRITKLDNGGTYKSGFNFEAENKHENEPTITTTGEAQKHTHTHTHTQRQN